jgi:dihydrofolate reductase
MLFVEIPGLDLNRAADPHADPFKHGGWHVRYLDKLSQKQAVENIVEAGAFLLGRRTYEIFASYWPTAPRRNGRSPGR